MLSFLFTVIMLTVVFSATAGLAFIFRKSAFRGRESGMYYIWLAAIIFALIPIRIGEPYVILFPQENRQAQNNNTDIHGNTVKLSEMINYANTRPDITDDFPNINANPNKADAANSPNAIIQKTQPENGVNILQLISDNKDAIIVLLLTIWLAGFTFVLTKTIYNYFKMKRLFYKESDICADEKLNGIFIECLESVGLRIGIKKRISLRVMKWGYSSPCVCGLINPTVFIDSACVSLTDKKLKYIFIHELYHIKRYDMLYKILSIIAAGVHWFNPLIYKVVKTTAEDCELSVDKYVMNIFGKKSEIPLDEQSDYYMNIILEIAERKCAGSRPSVSVPYTSLFFGEKRNIDFLKRRYTNMKNNINKKHLIIALAIFMAVIISINTIVMSSCGLTGKVEASDNNLDNLPAQVLSKISSAPDYPDANVYESALRLYFGLLPDELITQEQLDEITSIKIIKGVDVKGTQTDNINGVELGSMTPVSFVINDREFSLIPQLVHKRVFEEYIEKKISEYFTDENTENVEFIQQFGMSRELAKLNAYYSIKDPNAPDITPEAIEELRLTYPIAFEFPIAVFDPNSSEREYLTILGYFAAAGLLDDSFVQNSTIDASYLTKLTNLKNITLQDITLQNSDVLPNNNSVVIMSVESNLPEEPPQEQFYTYEEYKEYVEREQTFLLTLIDCTDENWMPISGDPVLTQEIYDREIANLNINAEKALEDIKNGAKIPILPYQSYPYACYETLADHLNLDCRTENGKWVLYNIEGTITETFDTKEDMLARARWWLSRGLPAGEVDRAQANTVYKRLYNYETAQSNQLQGPSGIFEAPNYGINTAADGTKYLEFKNQSLHAALCEYFGVGKMDYITPDMLGQITSIKAEIIHEYDYIYDKNGEQLRNKYNLNCQYIKYTINGKTLDILPESFEGNGLIESSLERESIDILQYFDKIVDDVVNNGSESYELCHYVPKSDLSVEDKLFVYEALARQASARIAIYIDSDGKYFTVSQNPSIFGLGFTARYYDKNEYDSTDIAYMPNLTDFNLDGIQAKK